MKDKEKIQISIYDLAAMTGLSIRTIRYYIASGLLPPPRARGRAAHYGEEHLLRLQVVRYLVERHIPLAEIRRRLEGLSCEELHALLTEEQARRTRLERAEQASQTRDYLAELIRDPQLPTVLNRREMVNKRFYHSPPEHHDIPFSQRALEPDARSPEPPIRWQLAPGVTLLVERVVYERYRRLIELLLRVARAIVNEMDG